MDLSTAKRRILSLCSLTTEILLFYDTKLFTRVERVLNQILAFWKIMHFSPFPDNSFFLYNRCHNYSIFVFISLFHVANRKLWFAEKSAFTLFRLMVKIDIFSFFTLLAQQRLDGNGAVHQSNTFIFRMFIYACIFKRRILVTTELKNGIVHLSFVENSNT